MPKVLDGQWHHLWYLHMMKQLLYMTPYIDGAPMAGLPAGFGNVSNNGAPRGKLSFGDVSGFTIGGAGTTAKNANSWMGNFNGGTVRSV